MGGDNGESEGVGAYLDGEASSRKCRLPLGGMASIVGETDVYRWHRGVLLASGRESCLYLPASDRLR
jgi:hypothetical protein